GPRVAARADAGRRAGDRLAAVAVLAAGAGAARVAAEAVDRERAGERADEVDVAGRPVDRHAAAGRSVLRRGTARPLGGIEHAAAVAVHGERELLARALAQAAAAEVRLAVAVADARLVEPAVGAGRPAAVDVALEAVLHPV